MIAKTKYIEKSNLLDIIALILGIFILFMQPLKNLNSVFSLIDECVLLLTLLIFVIITLKSGKIKNNTVRGTGQIKEEIKCLLKCMIVTEMQ